MSNDALRASTFPLSATILPPRHLFLVLFHRSPEIHRVGDILSLKRIVGPLASYLYGA